MEVLSGAHDELGCGVARFLGSSGSVLHKILPAAAGHARVLFNGWGSTGHVRSGELREPCWVVPQNNLNLDSSDDGIHCSRLLYSSGLVSRSIYKTTHEIDCQKNCTCSRKNGFSIRRRQLTGQRTRWRIAGFGQMNESRVSVLKSCRMNILKTCSPVSTPLSKYLSLCGIKNRLRQSSSPL